MSPEQHTPHFIADLVRVLTPSCPIKRTDSFLTLPMEWKGILSTEALRLWGTKGLGGMREAKTIIYATSS